MQTVIISGGSSGIGKSCVTKFILHGYYVYNLDITPDSVVITNNYKYIQVDVTNHEAIKAAINTIVSEHTKIDAVIISAGQHLSANIETTTDEQLLALMNLNLFGAYWLIREVIPYMKQQNKGNIVTVGSDQCSVAKPNSVVYGMTKSALLSLTKSVALDYAKYNIRANCIGAGTIETPLYTNAIIKYSEKSGIPLIDIERSEALEQPLGRVGQPEEVAELAYFLASDSSSFLTGALIPIDGGYTAK
jgi:2-keto-3-deoxy-L-fuconate dehydrogenase